VQNYNLNGYTFHHISGNATTDLQGRLQKNDLLNAIPLDAINVIANVYNASENIYAASVPYVYNNSHWVVKVGPDDGAVTLKNVSVTIGVSYWTKD
jgi:hypothetical protein